MNTIMKEYNLEEVDGKQYFVHHFDNSVEPTMDSGDADNNYFSVPTLFYCPTARIENQYRNLLGVETWENWESTEIYSSPYFNGILQNKEYYSDDYYKSLDVTNHPILPLFWCNKKHRDGVDFADCGMCHSGLTNGYSYPYYCVKCDETYHKECVESQLKIKLPYHPDHPFKLFHFIRPHYCGHCDYKRYGLMYCCTICNLGVCTICAQRSIPYVIDEPKRHDHPLTFFTRRSSLDCNVCGLINKTCSTFVCLKCNFVAHQDCADFPSVIRISRHHHRIHFASSLPPRKWSCGVCRKNVDSGYSAYTCMSCDSYIVHSKCAVRKDIWDGTELEGLPEEFHIEYVVEPFTRISNGIILHFLHDHHLKLEVYGEVYDEKKICHACVIPIYEGKFYSCMECDFILHDTCANAPRKIQHPLRPYLLTLEVNNNYDGIFKCSACYRESSGFIYKSNAEGCYFKLDVRCASIYEPFDYQGHEHHLFLALDPLEKHLCQICQKHKGALINCIECDFIRCFECITIPYMARYKHDKHFLELGCWEETNEPDWCEVCEKLIFSKEDGDKRFYRCKQCCTTLHIRCLLGDDPYMKPGHMITARRKKFQILPNNSLSRPTCDYCHERCVDKVFYRTRTDTFCSLHHLYEFDKDKKPMFW